MKTVTELFREAAQRAGVKLSAPEYLATHHAGDYWCASTIDGRWVRVSADVFETELDSTIEAALDEAIASAVGGGP